MSELDLLRSARLGATLAACLVASAWPAAAHAEPPAAMSNEARAEQLFSSAERKFDSGDYEGACADFAASLKLGPQLGTLLNLALCHETTGKIVTAWSEFTHAAVWAAQNNQRDRWEFATQHIRDLEPKLPRVVLELPPERAISGLDLDGEPLPEQRWYLPLYLDPGEHRIAVTAPGKRRTTVAFRVTDSPTDQLVYIPQLEAEAPPALAPPEPPKRQGSTRRTLAWIGVGAGAAGVALGTTFGVLAMTAPERDPAVQRNATFATAGFLAGAALAGAGLWLHLSSPGDAAKTSVSVAPHPTGAALSAVRSF